MSLDVIIPAYRNLDITARAFFGVLLNSPRDTRITLVDNGSEGTLDALKPVVLSLGQRWLGIDVNVGPYGAVNAGLALCDRELVSVVCNDVVVLPFSLAALVEAVSDKNPSVGAVELQDSYFCGDELLEKIEDEGLRSGPPTLRPGVFFSCFVAKRSLFLADQVGLFDERFRLTYGDTDWEQRYADLGYTHLVAPFAPVFHGASVTRKRLGIDEDIRVDTTDYACFIDKWTGLSRHDVVAKHPPENTAFKRAWTEREWRRVGHL